MKYTVTLLILAFLASCGGGHNPDLEALKAASSISQIIGQQRFLVVSGQDTHDISGGVIEGTAKVRSLLPLEKVDSANNFVLTFQLFDEGSVTLYTNSFEDLSAGISFTVTSNGEGNSPTVVLKAGDDVFDLSEDFDDVKYQNGEITLSLDIHNDHGASTHFIIWNDEGEEIIDDLLNGRGNGSYWGLDIKNAKVTNVIKREEQKPH